MRKEQRAPIARLVAILAVFGVVMTCVPTFAWAKAEHKHEADGFVEWTRTDAMPEAAGKYCLAGNVRLAQTWKPAAGTTELCLNGKTITLKAGAKGSLVDVPNGATLTVTDCADKAGGLRGGTGTDGKGGVVLVEEGGTFDLQDATVSGGKVTAVKEDEQDPKSKEVSLGGGVYVDGTFAMKNSTVENNKAATGAGVYVSDKGTISVEGTAKVASRNKDASNNDSNVVLANGKTIKVADKLEAKDPKKANIGVTLLDAEGNETVGTITDGFKDKMGDEDTSKYFLSNSDTFKVVSNTEKTEARLAAIVTVSFDANGGMGEDPDVVSGEEGSTVTLPANKYTRDGYTFTCWNTLQNPTDDDPGTEFADGQEGVVLAQGMTLYAQWEQDEPEPIQHTVTFEANGGNGTMESQTGVEGEVITLNPNAFTYDGHTFAGWNEEPDGSGESYVDEESFVLNEDLDLYAQWEADAVEYTVTFYANGGTGTMEPQTGTDDESFELAANAFTRDGYTFTGWNTQADGMGASYDDQESIALTESLDLYAQWEKDEPELVWFTITFDPNHGEGTMESVTDTEGTTVRLATNQFTRDGYTFTGWNTQKNGKGKTYANRASVKLEEDLTLYAQWRQDEAEVFTVTFNKNASDATGTMADQTGEDGTTAPLIANKYTREGYTFEGWNTKKGGSGTAYEDEEEFSFVENVTLYAQWKADDDDPEPAPSTDELTITFNKNADDAAGTMKPQTAKKGESFAVSANAFTRSGYYFASWNTKADGSGTNVPDKAKVKLNSNVTLYAQWATGEAPVSTDGLTITFNKNADDATGTMKPQTAKKGESFALNANEFTRPGYSFSAWNTKADGSGTKVPDKAKVKLNSSVTLYAQWVAGGSSSGSSGSSGSGGAGTSATTQETGVSGVKLTYNRGDGAPQVAAANMSTVAQAVLSGDERAQGVTLTISTSALDFNGLAADDQSKISEFTSRYGLTTGSLFDMTLSKQVGTNAPVAITELGTNSLQFSVSVPSELQATDGSSRTFYLLRLHGGEVKALAGTTNTTITAKTDKLSTFVIAYRGGSSTASGNPLSSNSATATTGTNATTAGSTTRSTKATTAKTGDSSVTGVVIGAVAVIGVIAVVIGLRQRSK